MVAVYMSRDLVFPVWGSFMHFLFSFLKTFLCSVVAQKTLNITRKGEEKKKINLVIMVVLVKMKMTVTLRLCLLNARLRAPYQGSPSLTELMLWSVIFCRRKGSPPAPAPAPAPSRPAAS